MAAIATIYVTTLSPDDAVLNSRITTGSATVAFDKTFLPDGEISPGVHQWSERSSSYPVAHPKYTISVQRPKPKDRNFRVKERLVYPVLNAVGGYNSLGIPPIPSVAHNMFMAREFVLSEQATPADKLLFWSYILSLGIGGIYASDDNPSVATGNVVRPAVLTGEQPY